MITRNTIGQIQADGSIIWTDRRSMGLGDVAQSAGIASASLTSLKTGLAPGGALVPVLLQAGVSAQAIPVIGTVVGVLSITAGLIAKAQSKAKAINAQKADVEAQNQMLREQIGDLNSGLTQVVGTRDQITSQLNAIGINVNGLGSLKSFLQETFTPGKVAQKDLNQALAENSRLTIEAQNKYDTLNYLQSDLQSLFDTLTKGIFKQNSKKVLLWVGGATVVTGLGLGLYFLNKKYKWIKF